MLFRSIEDVTEVEKDACDNTKEFGSVALV